MLIGYLVTVLVALVFSTILFMKNYNIYVSILLTVLICAGFVAIYHFYGITYRTVMYVLLYTILLLITACDVKEQMVGNDLLMVGAATGILLLPINRDYHTFNFILTGLGMMLLFMLISRATKNAIGMGDAYIFGIVGLYLGALHTLSVLLLAVIIGGAVTLVLFVFRIVGNKTTLPFAPFVMAGFLVSILL